MMDCQKIENGLQHTAIGASAFHMVGYLGKDHNSAQVISDGCCPACKKKGLIQHLTTYRISFEESLFLCENSECIYPLGFEPLSNIVIPIDGKGQPCEQNCRKRKAIVTRLVTSVIEPASKLTRTNNAVQTFKLDPPSKCNGNNPPESQTGQPHFPQTVQPNLCSAAESTEQQMGTEVATEERSSEMSRVQMPRVENSERGSSVSQILSQDKGAGPETLWLQWRNAHALCWLDCILSALVHLETLRTVCTASVSENVSIIQKLFAKYNQATALVNNCDSGDTILEVPSDVLSRAESYLNEIRNIIFVQLQTQLKCKLGEEESPVFAFPLLLRKDAPIEELFLHSFSWKFECLQCGHHVTERCQKILTTFTNIIPEWHPLNAIHIAPCNNCNHTSQRRKMVLENVASLLMLHFVEGLPHSDLAAYSFRFQDYSYQVKAVVQYQESKKHFITWVLNSDETWLECDDLKGSYCKKHKNFGVSPAEVHIVIWERRPPPLTSNKDLQLQNERAMTFSKPKTPPKSLAKYINDKSVENTSLVCHNDMSNVHPNEAETLVSNNKSNLLWGLENLASNDIVVLSLINVPLDSEGKPLEDSRIMQNNLTAKTGTLQRQGSGQISVLPCSPEGDVSGTECTLPKRSSAPLHQSQSSNASSTSVTPSASVNSSSYSPATLSVHDAQLEVNLLQGKDSHLAPVNAQKEDCKSKLGNSLQKTPNIIQQIRETPANCHVSDPGGSSQFGHKKGMKLSTASWVKGLIGKHSLLPKSVSACNEVESSEKSIQKEGISTSFARHAGQFRGFQAKWSNKTTKNVTSDYSHKTSPTSPFANSLIEKRAFGGNEGTGTKSSNSLVTSRKQIYPPQNGSKNSASFDHGKTAGDLPHQLRLKLLQDLKAKKEKLASLDKLAKAQGKKRSSSKKNKKDQPQRESEPQRESDSLQSLLNALEHQIDVEYSKSVNSPLTSVSQCSNSSYDDILSELLSPAPTVASLEPPQEECRYLEMGGGSPTTPVLHEKLEAAQVFNLDHNYTIPEKKDNGSEGPSDFLTLKSPLKKLDFESPAKQDILDDLLPNSVLNSVMADTDLHHFDESLLIW
ncbi:hypothetical protein JRQ81_019744 [Phrynocephalus forsythii]|uniref:USP domain-containing protein n=1 Tax=Phrynocephalus forsythii TaxID=171643 RepID=A0A9Q0XN87_9SAUR|nr:hypothetical protein JRQ81_019744 [Phrynocephalus forsythii]